MENVKKLSDKELSDYFDLVAQIKQVMEENDRLPLPLPITNALSTFELKLEKEFTRREL